VSEIPFVNQLGDAMDAAIATPRRATRGLLARRRRRFAALALALLAAGATGAIAMIGVDPDEAALGAIACYESADLGSKSSVVIDEGRSPTAACRALRPPGQRATPLVACIPNGDGVAVIPGRGGEACERLGLRPLPAPYADGSPKVARLSRAIAAIEERTDCIPPRELARRAQALLERTGWTGWRTRTEAGDGGPCGWIRRLGGADGLHLGSAALRTDIRELRVAAGPPRSLHTLLYGSRAVSARLFDVSGERCFTVPGLRRRALELLAASGRKVRFRYGHLPRATGLMPPRGDRYDQGCAIFAGAAPVYPEPGRVGVEVEIWRKGL
jgi:hypothetical protein